MNFRDFFINQNWWGKIIGAFMGYLIAGPVGALFGLLVGNIFDKGLNQYFSTPFWTYHAEKREKLQKQFFEAVFIVLGFMAKADGTVSKQEINLAKEFMKEMRLNSELQQRAKELFRQGKENHHNIEKVLHNLRVALHGNPELLRLFVDIQFQAAKTDGLSSGKIVAMNTVLSSLGFAPLGRQNRFYEEYSKPHQNHHHHKAHYDPLNQAYSLLELEPNASKHEVKKAYRRLISKNHPDKLIAQGLPEEMIKVANDKTQKITKAYESICQARGWN